VDNKPHQPNAKTTQIMRKKLAKQAEQLDQIRAFFKTRHILAVNTPLLSYAGVSDPYCLQWQATPYENHNPKTPPYFLQTSPEYAMKRYLAEGSGDIYQLCKAFRDDEHSPWHNIEFMMLEWYRIGFSTDQLMDELTELINHLALKPLKDVRLSYQDLFLRYANLNPHNATSADCLNHLKQHGVNLHNPNNLEKNDLLNALLTHVIEPKIQSIPLLFVKDFPANQAALAKINETNSQISHRFECWIQGIECANGFLELNNANLQRARFEQDNKIRQQKGLKTVPLDEPLLDMLDKMPDCAGVAVGVDRLLACLAEHKTIHHHKKQQPIA
jgi:elongation factor P--(R)-beta-lysine ligase